MPFLILSGALQLVLVLHCLKTGRDTKWVWVIVMMPLIGSLAYIILEAGPDFLQGSSGHRAKKIASNTLNPNKNINEATDNLALADTVENTTKLAEECMNKGKHQEAHDLYEKSLSGLYENDPYILSGLAKAQFELKQFKGTLRSLDLAIEKNPDYKNQDSHLLYARAKEELGDISGATEEYDSLVQYYTGPEPAYRYALMLKDNGQQDKAKTLLQDIAQKSKLSAKHYYNQHKQWIDLAKSELNNL